MGRTIVSLPGDGIGKTVLPEAIRVLDAPGFDAEYIHGDIGWDFWCREGNALPQRTIDLLEKNKNIAVAAVGYRLSPNVKTENCLDLHKKFAWHKEQVNQKMQLTMRLIHL